MRRGFTLIELLVVIAIIAILAAILFPVFAKAREKARQSSCLNNTKQMAIACLQYAQDYDEGLAPWFYAALGTTLYYPRFYDPYIKNAQVWTCPSRAGGTYSGSAYVMGAYPHYGYSCLICQATRGTASGSCPNWNGHKISTWDRPAETVLMAETCADDWPPTPGLGRTDLGSARCSMSTWLSGGNPYYNAFPHNEGRNIVLGDGHAKWYRRYGDTSLKFN
ncbi:DUF1559 domain-containing protein [bacterium]|nr:DUF1559 domain-containing protein [bacterium]